MIKRAFFILLSVHCFVPPSSHAQFWDFGALPGIAICNGDLAPSYSMQQSGLSAKVYTSHNINRRLAIRLGLSCGAIAADDAQSSTSYQQAKNLNFQSMIYEGSLCMEFNFLSFHHKSHKNKRQFSPYLLAGMGVFYHRPRTSYEEINYKLQALGTEGQTLEEAYSLVLPAFILGGGFKFDISPPWGILTECVTRLLFFDFLNGVSIHYANKDLIRSNRGALGNVAAVSSDRSYDSSNNLGEAKRQRGDTRNNDECAFLTNGLIYTFYEQKYPAYLVNTAGR